MTGHFFTSRNIAGVWSGPASYVGQILEVSCFQTFMLVSIINCSPFEKNGELSHASLSEILL